MTIDASTFAPTAAMIAAGFLVYFHTSSFADEYAPKVERIRTVLLGKMLEEQDRSEERAPSPAAARSPYFPESGYDEVVIRKLVDSQKADDYRRCVGMIPRGNALLRFMGIGLILIGIGLFPLFAVLPDPTSWFFLAFVIAAVGLVVIWFIRYDRLVRDIDRMDSSAYLGSLDVAWRR